MQDRIEKIEAEEDYDAALKQADALMDAGANTAEAEELNRLGDLIHAYEAVRYPIARPDPEPGEIWRHFKGSSNEIIGVSTVVTQEEIECTYANCIPPTFYAIDTETKAPIAVFRMVSGALWCAKASCIGDALWLMSLPEPYCFYRKPGVLGVWGRSLQMFMETKGDGFRFTKVS